jgi:hypothetical protein
MQGMNINTTTMKKLSGAHGTTVTRAEIILERGFCLNPGRRGTGAYFWRCGKYSRLLSFAWWDQCNKKSVYSEDENSECAIIYSKLYCYDDEYIYVSDFETKEKICSILNAHSIRSHDTKTIARVYDALIKSFENDRGKKIKIIEALVALPKSQALQSYPRRLIGEPHCYIVRSDDCISIVDCEKGVRYE